MQTEQSGVLQIQEITGLFYMLILFMGKLSKQHWRVMPQQSLANITCDLQLWPLYGPLGNGARSGLLASTLGPTSACLTLQSASGSRSSTTKT